MKPRLHASLAAAALILLTSATRTAGQATAPATAGGCPLEPVTFHACALPKTKTFNPPRTEDGRPDMQGCWDRAFTSQDVEEHGADGLNVQPGPSLVVDTPDHTRFRISRGRSNSGKASPIGSSLRSRVVIRRACLATRLRPPRTRSCSGLATSAYTLDASHSLHRIIPTGGEPHVGNAIRLWQGDSRGRWEGNTLVVDVTNLNGLAWLDNAGNFVSDALHVVERFTLIDRDTIHYEARLEDPKVYTRPWTMVSALRRNKEPGFEIWEQACHEGISP